MQWPWMTTRSRNIAIAIIVVGVLAWCVSYARYR